MQIRLVQQKIFLVKLAKKKKKRSTSNYAKYVRHQKASAGEIFNSPTYQKN